MRTHGVDHDRMLPELLYELVPDQSMRPFDVSVDRLSDIVKQAGPLRDVCFESKFCSHQTGQVRHLQAVGEQVLTVTRTVLHPADMFE